MTFPTVIAFLDYDENVSAIVRVQDEVHGLCGGVKEDGRVPERRAPILDPGEGKEAHVG